MCFIIHEWGKWEQYKRPMCFYPGILAPKELRGKEFLSIEHRQKRICNKCGKVQDKLIFED